MQCVGLAIQVQVQVKTFKSPQAAFFFSPSAPRFFVVLRFIYLRTVLTSHFLLSSSCRFLSQGPVAFLSLLTPSLFLLLHSFFLSFSLKWRELDIDCPLLLFENCVNTATYRSLLASSFLAYFAAERVWSFRFLPF